MENDAHRIQRDGYLVLRECIATELVQAVRSALGPKIEEWHESFDGGIIYTQCLGWMDWPEEGKVLFRALIDITRPLLRHLLPAGATPKYKASIGVYHTSTHIAHTKPNIFHVEIGMDKVIGPETGYPIHYRGSHKIEKLPSDQKERDAMVERIQLKDGDVIMRDGCIWIQGTGTNLKACSMLLQIEWDTELSEMSQ